MTCGASDRSDGITLLEVVISASLLAVLAMASSLLVVPLWRQARLDRELVAVARVAEDTIEGLRTEELASLRRSLPRTEPLSIAGGAGELEVSAENESVEPLVLRITIRWESADDGQEERILYTARGD